MKRFFLLILIGLWSISAEANTGIPATIVKKNGQHIEGVIEAFQDKIITASTFSIRVKGKYLKIKQSDIKEIYTASEKYEMISYRTKVRQGNRIKEKHVRKLAELLVRGKVKLYVAYSVRKPWHSIFNSDKALKWAHLNARMYLISSSDASAVYPKDFGRKIKRFFPKCDSLLAKVKEGLLGFDELEETVEEGNKCLRMQWDYY